MNGSNGGRFGYVRLVEDVLETLPGWASHQGGSRLTEISSVTCDAEGYVYALQRLGHPIIRYAPDGVSMGPWGPDQLLDGHGITASRGGVIVVASRDGHAIVLLDRSGTEVARIGDGTPGRFQEPMNHPAAAFLADDDSLYVADGYGNAAVHVFNASGDVVRSWGGPGREPGRFRTPHGIWVSPGGVVYVTDRDNDRVQVFDSDGGLRGVWDDFVKPMDIVGDGRGRIYVTDQAPRVSALSDDGTLLGRFKSQVVGSHGIAMDGGGNIFLAERPPTTCITKFRVV